MQERCLVGSFASMLPIFLVDASLHFELRLENFVEVNVRGLLGIHHLVVIGRVRVRL